MPNAHTTLLSMSNRRRFFTLFPLPLGAVPSRFSKLVPRMLPPSSSYFNSYTYSSGGPCSPPGWFYPAGSGLGGMPSWRPPFGGQPAAAAGPRVLAGRRRFSSREEPSPADTTWFYWEELEELFP